MTYPIAGLTNLAPGGVTIPFEDGHTRQLPVITSGPFRYATQAWTYLDAAGPATSVPLKQAVISASALSLLYPGDGIDGYPREAFVEDRSRRRRTSCGASCSRRDGADRLHRRPRRADPSPDPTPTSTPSTAAGIPAARRTSTMSARESASRRPGYAQDVTTTVRWTRGAS